MQTLATNKDTSPAVPMGTALGWAVIGLGLEFFLRNKRTI